ncbi:MAG: NIPSNAP family protein [Opitutaceae bacterium]|nr:NIPSNAP family protein [Opitutaceae bacterium]
MKLRRREFLKTSLAASATAALGSNLHAASKSSAAGREYYELRCYRLKPGGSPAPLNSYLEKALLPALDKRGIKNVGVFTELEVEKKAGTSKPMANSPVWVLIPHTTLDSFATTAAELNQDPAVQKAGGEYLRIPKSSPAFERVDTWLYRAFKGMPKMEIPAFSKSKTSGRVFEMRDYESHSELAALSKMTMFDEGETEIMRDLGMSPMLFGQSLAGPNLPHLRYFTGGPSLEAHLANWKKFGPDPRWQKMSKMEKYKDTTSKNTARFVVPTAYSTI